MIMAMFDKYITGKSVFTLGMNYMSIFYAMRHNDAGGGGWGAITNDILKFRKIIEIVMNCQWIVSSYTKSA